MSWLDKFFAAIGVENHGVAMLPRSTVNLIGSGVTVTDNPAQGTTDVLIAGSDTTLFTLDGSSVALVAGDVFCASGSAGTVTKATAAALAIAGAALGVALASASPGGTVISSIDGLVPSSVTGLAASPGYARVSSAAHVELVSALSPGDYPLGGIDAAGTLTLLPTTAVGAAPGASLTGLQWLLPRVSDSSSTTYVTVPKQTVTAVFPGDPNVTYAVTLRFRGVIEAKTYTSGVGDGAFWNANGAPALDGWNLYSLATTSPANVYYLNSGTSGVTALNAVDYTKTILINGGATITLVADSLDGIEVANNVATGGPLSVAGITSPAQPYVGQFLRIDFVSSAISSVQAPRAPASIAADDVLVWRCNDGPNAAVVKCQGTYGTSSYVSPITPTTTTADFTVPAVASNVTVAVASTVGYYVGAPVSIGGGAGRYQVASIASLTSMAVTNLSSVGNPTLGGLNAAAGATIAHPVAVSPVIENVPTTTTVDFTTPAVSSTVQITVASTAGLAINGQVYIGPAGYYQVVTVDSAVLMTVKSLIAANLASGHVCAAGCTVVANQDMIAAAVNRPPSCNGLFADALFFPGDSAAAYGTFTNTAARFFGSKLTIELWFKPPSLPVSNGSLLFGRQHDITSWTTNSFRDLAIGLPSSATPDGTWNVFADNGSGELAGAAGVSVTKPGRLVQDQYNYMVVTLDYSLTANNVILYLNGVPVTTFSDANSGVAWNRFAWGAGGAWILGNVRSAVSTWVSNLTLGAISECRVHQGVHSATHIASVWAQQSAKGY